MFRARNISAGINPRPVKKLRGSLHWEMGEVRVVKNEEAKGWADEENECRAKIPVERERSAFN